MKTHNVCPACMTPVLPTQEDPANERQDAGCVVAWGGRDASGEDVYQRWHPTCREAEKRRSQRRAGDTPDMLNEIREALR